MDYLALADRNWPVLSKFAAAHTALYRASGGRIGQRLPGAPPMLLLDHVGARTGTERTTPLAYVSDGDDLVLIASKGGQGTANVTIQNLLESALRMRPDRLFVGEIRGAEAFSFLRAINTGHPGSMSTVHADTPLGAYEQLAMMMQQSGMSAGYSKQDLMSYIQMVIPIVIQLRREGGKRGVSEIYFARDAS